MTYEIEYEKSKTAYNQIRVLVTDGVESIACYFTEDQIKNDKKGVKAKIQYATEQMRKFHEFGKHQ